MIFDPDDSPSEKLHKASDHFLKQIGLHAERRREMDKAFAFRHGDQWDPEAKRQLEEEGRPCLVFNLLAPMARELIGANQDQRREPQVEPVGDKNLPTSEVINKIWERIYTDKCFQDIEDKVFEDGTTCGTGFAYIDAQPSCEDPALVEVTLEACSPYDVYYDIEASATNLTDSPFFYWARWIPETRFKREHPELADQYEELVSEMGPIGFGGSAEREGDLQYFGKQPSEIYRDSKLFDRKNRRIRVIHLEYEVPKKKYFAWDPRVSHYQEVKKSTYDAFNKSGVTQTASAMGSEWRVFEFTGLQIIFDDKLPLPLYRSQILPFTCWYDANKKYHYGMIRDLQDPQMEFNKRYSQELNQLNKNTQPGVFVDTGSLGDVATAERKMRQPGFLIEKTPGTTPIFTPAPEVPAGADRMGERSLALVQTIGGVDLNPLLGGQPNDAPVGTSLLAHRKGLMSISPILTNFRAFQRVEIDSTVRIMLTVFTDEQIAEMLGNAENLSVKDGVVSDQEAGTQVDLSDLRAVRWSIQMDSAAANTTAQLLLLNMYTQLVAAGVPIDHDEIFETLPVSGEVKQRLKAYAAQAQAAAAQTQQQEQQVAKDQVDNVVKIEAAKVQSQAMSDKQASNDARMKATLDAVVKLVQSFVNATGDTQQMKLDAVEHGIKKAKGDVDEIATLGDLALTHRQQGIDQAAAAQPAAQQ